MAAEKRKPGRPEVPKKLKKVGFSIKVRPVLLDAIKKKIKKSQRSREIEALLEQKYL